MKNGVRLERGAPHNIPELVKSAPSTIGKPRIPRQICPN
jgi:hypothetical protein